MNNSELFTYLCEYKKELEILKNSEAAVKAATSKVKIKDENSNKLLVYMGSFRVDKKIGGAVERLTSDESKAKYKRYIDIETGSSYNVNMDEVEKFEKEHNVIYRKTLFNSYDEHYQNYKSVREEFFRGIIKEEQDKVVLRLTREDQ